MAEIKTTMSTLDDYLQDDAKMTGSEIFNIYNDDMSILRGNQLDEIVMGCKGLKSHWNCLEKAKIVQSILGEASLVVIGSLAVISECGQSSYGYAYEPPLEFHAWVMVKAGIIDVALPGVINKGMNTSDEYGPYILGREEVVLAGMPADWMQYKAHEVHNIHGVKATPKRGGGWEVGHD